MTKNTRANSKANSKAGGSKPTNGQPSEDPAQQQGEGYIPRPAHEDNLEQLLEGLETDCSDPTYEPTLSVQPEELVPDAGIPPTPPPPDLGEVIKGFLEENRDHLLQIMLRGQGRPRGQDEGDQAGSTQVSLARTEPSDSASP